MTGSPLKSPGLLNILADLNNALIWVVFIHNNYYISSGEFFTQVLVDGFSR